MVKLIIRCVFLLSLVAIGFLFSRSEQFGKLESKVVSLDFSANGDWLAVSTNHALWDYDEEYARELSDFARKLHLVNLSDRTVKVFHEEPIPLGEDTEISFEEWGRILGQRPNYEMGVLPFSPVQFVGDQLVFVDFSSNQISGLDIHSSELTHVSSFPASGSWTLGWFLMLDSGDSVIFEDDEFQLHQFSIEDGMVGEIPMCEPFYVDSQNLSLGGFVDLRMLGEISEPRPIFGASCHPQKNELAVATVLQICFMRFDGSIPRRLMSHRLEVGSMIHYSPDGELMAAVHEDIVRFFSSRDRKTKIVITNAEQPITSFAWSPDNRFFATGDNLGTVRVWDVSTFELLASHNLVGDWRVHWFVPYLCGFVWTMLAIASFKTERGDSQPDFESRTDDPTPTNEAEHSGLNLNSQVDSQPTKSHAVKNQD